jgi:CubicO group peptidase (beta-lactamase class C family)
LWFSLKLNAPTLLFGLFRFPQVISAVRHLPKHLPKKKFMTKRLILVLLLFAAFAPAAFAQKDRRILTKSRLEPLIEKTIRENKIPGFAIGIVENGKVIYAKGFGVAKLGDDKPITSKSLFHMASVTKPFVATAIMQLVERGKINLDARVTEYLPYFRMKDERFAAITVRQLLGHMSGMPDIEDDKDYNWDKPEYDDGALERYVRSLSNLSLIAAPSEKFQYSNIAFEVLGDVIAKASGESFESYVQRNIFKPLGMKHSTLLNREANQKLLTTPHIQIESGVTVSKVFPYNRAHAPSSTLYSNIDDMNRWAMANLNRGELNGKRILKATSYDLLWTPQADVEAGRKAGLGWFLTERNGHQLLTHLGGDVGFNSLIVLAPDDSISIVAMSNYSPNENHYVRDIVFAAIDLLLSEKR